MARRKLTREQENWLYLYYPNTTNKELAEKLTEMICIDNQKQLKRLKRMLEEDLNEDVRKVINKKIEAIENFNGISEAYIKRFARNLHCPRKSRTHIVACNQQKAKATNIKRWLKKAENVDHIMEWLRTFDEKDVRCCFVDGIGQLKSFRVSINKFNRDEGYNRGVYLSSQYVPEAGLLRVHASLYRTVSVWD